MGSEQAVSAKRWFPREQEYTVINEMVRDAGQYDYRLTLLLMPEADRSWVRHDDEETEEDTFDRFIRNGQYPVRD